ncbi:hypothetical protein IFM89_027166 [Coptis chinensis]|uniref:Protein kinase domain-containing protein n=1 Tax=Coptis chinensis TaxID=261450 RepID=A0A835IBL7_9MAGN|nr:hypothetical protein IFM89_027166 [Coptis chinensis]
MAPGMSIEAMSHRDCTTPLLRGEKKHYDHKVDIYSFSIVLRELLTNLTPFKGMTSIQAAYAVASRSNKYMMMSMAGNGGMNGSNIGNVRNGGAASISAAATAIDHTRFPRRRERNSKKRRWRRRGGPRINLLLHSLLT